MNLDCTGCNAPCCQMLKFFPAMKDMDRGDGRCKHLTDDLKCSIYKDRPDFCRVDLHQGKRTDEEYKELVGMMCKFFSENLEKLKGL